MNEANVVTFVLGGARSGKSEVAEQLAAGYAGDIASEPAVTYVATGNLVTGDGSDGEWEGRIAAHRARRPSTWATVELDHPAQLATALLEHSGVVLVDSLGTWIVGLPDFEDASSQTVVPMLEAVERRRKNGRPTVIVSEEVGLGVHPPTEVGGRFRDALGTLNRQVAAVADRVLLVVAGRVLPLERP